MESPAPFDLTHAIQSWRKNLAQSPAIRSENLDELETHLRDSVALLESHGLSGHEAFVVAANRVGKNASLEVEFEKVNGKSVWLDRVLWMLIGIQVWGVASSSIGGVARTALAFGWRSSKFSFKADDMALPVALFGLVQLVALAASVWLCWWLVIRKGGKFSAWLERRLQGRAGLIACCLKLSLILFLFTAFSYSLPMLLSKFLTMDIYGQNSTYSNFAQAIVWPIQSVIMMTFTLLLARKRFRMKQA